MTGGDITPDQRELAAEILRQETGIADGSLTVFGGYVIPNPPRDAGEGEWTA